MNAIFAALFVLAFAFAALGGRAQGFSTGLFEGVKSAVDVALGLTGALGLWLGLVKILEKAGAIDAMSRVVGPLVRRIFPGIPAGHPALAAMTLNIAANMLGLGNAATPFGLKAMEELDKLNPKKATLSDAQALFLALNTANVTLVPATVIALRATAKPHAAAQPADILVPGLLASLCATLAALFAARLLARLPRYRRQFETAEDKSAVGTPGTSNPPGPT
jgi:spore maturation protein SpmA